MLRTHRHCFDLGACPAPRSLHISEPRKLSFNTTFSTQNIGLGFRVITFTPEEKHTGMFGAMPEAPSGIAPNTFPCFCCPGILFVYQTETATLSSQKIRMSLFGRKKAPAGALSPSTVLLRGILSVYKTKTAILCSQKIRMSFSGRKKPLRARSALAPCLFVFTTYRFCLCYI